MANYRASMQRNTIVEQAMEIQALAAERIEADIKERRVLREMVQLAEAFLVRAQWLHDQQDPPENEGHEAIMEAGRRICVVAEKTEPVSCSNTRRAS